MWKQAKEIEVNKSSLVELKAELFRRKAEYDREKTDPAERAALKAKAKKPTALKQNRGVEARSQRDAQQLAEEARDADRSRRKLEEKAKLYDELKRRAAENNFEDEERILVDFERKAWQEEDESSSDDMGPASPRAYEAATADDEWVEYLDDLGRTRKCLRKDLPYMKAREERMPRRSPSPERNGSDDEEANEQFPLPKRLRTEAEAPKSTGPVHFQEVLGTEIRDLGVGYFGFSTDPLERQRQMDELKRLREQTLELRTRRARQLERKKDALERRLAKVRERKEKREQERMQATGMEGAAAAASSAEVSEEEEEEEESFLPSATSIDFLKSLEADLNAGGQEQVPV